MGRVPPRRIAITGATGFIGSQLAAYLIARGDEIRAIVRPESSRRTPPSTTIVRAALSKAALVPAFRDIETVVHVAGITQATRRSDFDRINVEGTRAVAQAAEESGASVVYISSLAAAGPASLTRPHTESDPPRPATPYGQSKLDGEHALAGAARRWTALRPGPVYGPGDRAFLRLFRWARRGVLPLFGRAGAGYTFVYIADLVRLITAAIDHGPVNETFFVGHADPITLRDLVNGIRLAVNPTARTVSVPLAMTRVVASALDIVSVVSGRVQPLDRWRYREVAAEGFVCRVDRIRERFGVGADTPLTAGLTQTADWYRQQGWL